MNENSNPMEEIEKEIEEAKSKSGGDDFEIEIAEDEIEETKQKENLDDEQHSARVRTRINKLTEQRRAAELESKKHQEETAQLKARLERLEKGNVNQREVQAQNEFQKRYNLTKQALHKAVEEGDTDAQVNFSEQIADMRAAVRVQQMEKQMRAQRAYSPTVGKAQQASANPPPAKAMSWWESNKWF
jgi:ATP phosphoribosyltransferase regulatory subunit HisZ